MAAAVSIKRGVLAARDDSEALAAGIEPMARDGGLFASMSAAAARRVRDTNSADRIIPQEIDLLRRLYH